MTTIGRDILEHAMDNESDHARRGEIREAMHILERIRESGERFTLVIKLSILGFIGIIIATALLFVYGYASRNYDVWAMEMSGKAKLAEATQSRQIAIEGAKAKQESATFEAEAEVRRARGVAEANKIIGKSLQDNDGYLKYLWINQLNENNQNVIYIPTENGMPIMEAGKR